MDARFAGRIPDTVLLLEHTPTITLGARGRTESLIAADDVLASEGVDLVHSTRGGDVTYHAPGQAIIYPILRLGEREADTHGHLHNLEEIAIRTLSEFGVSAYRRAGLTGAWTDSGKVAAIGVRFRRWITMHGMSLNVRPDMSGFDRIVPCGLAEEKVVSMVDLLGDGCPEREVVRDSMLRHFQAVCNRDMTRFCRPADWPPEFASLYRECIQDVRDDT